MGSGTLNWSFPKIFHFHWVTVLACMPFRMIKRVKKRVYLPTFLLEDQSEFRMDTEGPLIELFLDDESFESGDMTGANPILIARFSDENGINTSGGLGHELLAVLDGMTQNPIVLNNFIAQISDYKSGF